MWVQFKFGGLRVRRRLPKHDDHYYRLLDIDVEPMSCEKGGYKEGVRVYFTAIQPAYTTKGRSFQEAAYAFMIESGKVFLKGDKDTMIELDLSLPRFARDQDDGMVLSALLSEVLYFLWEAERLIFSDKSIQRRRDSERAEKAKKAAANEKAKKATEEAKAAAAAAAATAAAAAKKAADAAKKAPKPKKAAAKPKRAAAKSTKKKGNGTNGNGKDLVAKNQAALEKAGLVKKKTTKKKAAAASK